MTKDKLPEESAVRTNRYRSAKEGISLCREVIRRQDVRLGFKLMISVAGERRLMDPQQGLPGDGNVAGYRGAGQ